MKKYFNFPLFVIIALILKSCASVAPPKGGEKDIEKPKVIKTIPESGTTNFQGNTIKYYFSEWVAEDKLRDNIIITPRIEDFESKIVKNSLIIKFDTNSFLANTTYSINLREGIKDLTEGTKTDSTTLVFSTGKYLDSLSIEGKVYFGDDFKKSKDIIVSLYNVTDTFKLENEYPVYATKTDSSSSFKIDFMKPGKYYLYAYKDENNNNKYDKNKEAIGYLKDEINLKASISLNYINMFYENRDKPKIVSKDNRKKSSLKLEYSKEVKTISLETTDKRNILPSIRDKQITLFPDKASPDSVIIILNTTDALNNQGRDTIGAILNFADTTQIRYSLSPGAGASIEPYDSIYVVLTKPYQTFRPILSIKNGKEFITEKELKEDFVIRKNPAFNSISISSKKPWRDSVSLYVFPQSFIPLTGYLKDTLKANYILKDPEKFGTIGGTIESAEKNLIIQLINNKKVEKQITYKKEFLFEYLTEGIYSIRVIVDDNKNGKWDQGNYVTRELPETIYHYPTPIKLKSSWEILDVKITF